MAKTIELENLYAYYNSPSAISACQVSTPNRSPESILKNLRQYCDPQRRSQLDQILTMIQMVKFYDTTRRNTVTASSESVEDYLDKIQANLTPEQMQMLKNMQKQGNEGE